MNRQVVKIKLQRPARTGNKRLFYSSHGYSNAKVFGLRDAAHKRRGLNGPVLADTSVRSSVDISHGYSNAKAFGLRDAAHKRRGLNGPVLTDTSVRSSVDISHGYSNAKAFGLRDAAHKRRGPRLRSSAADSQLNFETAGDECQRGLAATAARPVRPRLAGPSIARNSRERDKPARTLRVRAVRGISHLRHHTCHTPQNYLYQLACKPGSVPPVAGDG